MTREDVRDLIHMIMLGHVGAYSDFGHLPYELINGATEAKLEADDRGNNPSMVEKMGWVIEAVRELVKVDGVKEEVYQEDAIAKRSTELNIFIF